GPEAAALWREAAKKDALPPLPAVLQELGGLLPRLKPCVLATPTTAVGLNPTQATFDVVILDEAHQLAPGEALAALARGRQVVLAGDEQMPPGTQLVPHLLDAAGDAPPPSLLDLCAQARVPSVPLRWVELEPAALASFNNPHFYERRLLTWTAA